MKQVSPCPECGEKLGWWSPLDRKSMIFRDDLGAQTEHRLYEKKNKYCAGCDAEVTKCVTD